MSIRETLSRTPATPAPIARIDASPATIADALAREERFEAIQFVHLGPDDGVTLQALTDFVTVRLGIPDDSPEKREVWEALAVHHLRILDDVGAVKWAPQESEFIRPTDDTEAFVEVAEMLFECSTLEGGSDVQP
jgi:hypothetical protein